MYLSRYAERRPGMPDLKTAVRGTIADANFFRVQRQKAGSQVERAHIHDRMPSIFYGADMAGNDWPPLPPVLTGMRARCPRRGQGKLFDDFLALKPKCSACG